MVDIRAVLHVVAEQILFLNEQRETKWCNLRKLGWCALCVLVWRRHTTLLPSGGGGGGGGKY